jgi:hypothetical protein
MAKNYTLKKITRKYWLFKNVFLSTMLSMHLLNIVDNKQFAIYPFIEMKIKLNSYVCAA